jgi:hypothetical protein
MICNSLRLTDEYERIKASLGLAIVKSCKRTNSDVFLRGAVSALLSSVLLRWPGVKNGRKQGFKGERFEPKIKEIPSGISLQLLSLYGMLNYVFSMIYEVLGELKK